MLTKPSEEIADLVATLQSNLAVVYMHLNKEKEAIVKAREALVSATPYYAKEAHEVSWCTSL